MEIWSSVFSYFLNLFLPFLELIWRKISPVLAEIHDYYLWFRVIKIRPVCDLKRQTRELPDGSRVLSILPEGKLLEHLVPHVTTIYEAVRNGLIVSRNGPMLGYRKTWDSPYTFLTYRQVLDRAVNVGEALRRIGIATGQETFIGIYSKNRPEWIIVEHACYNFSNVLVPLYDTLGAEACVFSLKQTEIQVVFVDTFPKAKNLMKFKEKCPNLKHIIVFDGPLLEFEKELAKEMGIELRSLARFERLGERSIKTPEKPPKPDDLATICYTSGTTGEPKGVMLTHGNIISNTVTLSIFDGLNLGQNDTTISYLPLAHMFERVCLVGAFTVGGKVGFFSGDVQRLPDDLQALKPTLFPVVPRVLNKIHDKIMEQANKNPIRKVIFSAALAIKKRELARGIVRNDSLVDYFVFRKIREKLGGRIRGVLTGSAPLSEEVLTFMRCALGAVIIEGYGQTECVACATITLEGDCVPGHVGVPSPCNAVKLVDVPELGYFAKNNAGEVCVKGYNVFKGYYKNEEQTKAALDEDGWLHTGDIGKWTNEGTLKIVDRKKHIFKLAQGEYVAPERIENFYLRSKYVAQVFVHGESLKTCLVAIVVPDPEVLPEEVEKELGIAKGTTVEELCKRSDVKKMILDDMTNVGKSSGLLSFEQAKDIYLCPEQFSIENGLLTPTLKLKRVELKQYFKDELAEMYKHFD